jgi:hypothetical protein
LSATAGSQEFSKLAREVSAVFTSRDLFSRWSLTRPNQRRARPIARVETQLAAAGSDYAACLAE